MLPVTIGCHQEGRQFFLQLASYIAKFPGRFAKSFNVSAKSSWQLLWWAEELPTMP
jgi:hypothetical protein